MTKKFTDLWTMEWNNTEAYAAAVPVSWNNPASCYTAHTNFVNARWNYLYNTFLPGQGEDMIEKKKKKVLYK